MISILFYCSFKLHLRWTYPITSSLVCHCLVLLDLCIYSIAFKDWKMKISRAPISALFFSFAQHTLISNLANFSSPKFQSLPSSAQWYNVLCLISTYLPHGLENASRQKARAIMELISCIIFLSEIQTLVDAQQLKTCTSGILTSVIVVYRRVNNYTIITRNRNSN